MPTDHDLLVELVTLVKGADGTLGVLGELQTLNQNVLALCRKQDELESKHNTLNGRFKLLVGILLGSGVLTGATVGVLRLVS